MKSNIFLTGATGFLGRNLLRIILTESEKSKVTLLVRGKSSLDAKKRICSLLNSILPYRKIEEAKKRINVICGDVTLNNFGVDDDLYSALKKNFTHIIHAAAAVQFELPLDEARRINCNGTKNIMNFSREVKDWGCLRRVAYVSTAFVCGDRAGDIKEDDLDYGQQFSNSYEQTKFESEKVVRSYMQELPLTIFRPSIIVGDSNTGQTTSFNVMYLPLNMIYKGKLKMLAGEKDIPLDVVPVNFVAESIYHILLNSNNCVGKTFHLTAGKDKMISAGEIIDTAVDYFKELGVIPNIKPIKFLSLSTLYRIKRMKGTASEKAMAVVNMYKPYLCTRRSFDNSNTITELNGTKIETRPLQDYYSKLLDYCVTSNWGKQAPSFN